MPILLENREDEATTGTVGFLRFLDEDSGSGIRAALFMASSQDVPLEFSFTRIDFHDSRLWRMGEARRTTVLSLIETLFHSAGRTPSVIVGLADEIPPLVFSENIRIDVPLCRVSTDPAPRRGASEEIEQIGASLFLVWSTSPPQEDSVARRLLKTIVERSDPLEPFRRVAAGIAEAYSDR